MYCIGCILVLNCECSPLSLSVKYKNTSIDPHHKVKLKRLAQRESECEPLGSGSNIANCNVMLFLVVTIIEELDCTKVVYLFTV